jgi:hypothetical protein
VNALLTNITFVWLGFYCQKSNAGEKNDPGDTTYENRINIRHIGRKNSDAGIGDGRQVRAFRVFAEIW